MLTLVNTAYMPPLKYMAALSRAQEVTIEVMETYRKQTCRNHCVIYGPNGRQTLTIPVIKVNGNHTMTKDVRISDHQPWQKIHWRSIQTAYNNSPFFLYYQDHFVPFYEKKYDFLVDFNTAILQEIIRVLKLQVSLSLTEAFEKFPTDHTDLRDLIMTPPATSPEPVHHYTQVFEPVHGFIPGLSILDAIFNLGPETGGYLILTRKPSGSI